MDLYKELAMKQCNSGWLYQIGVPITKMSTVMMFWHSFSRPRMAIHPSQKDEDLAVLEVRHDLFANALVEYIPDAKLKIVKDKSPKSIII